MGTNTSTIQKLIGGGLIALAAMLALCLTVWAPSAYADELVANQGEIVATGGGDDSEAAVNDISKHYYDYKKYLLFRNKVVTLEDLEVSIYRYDEAGNKVTLTSSDYGDPIWYSKAQARYIQKPISTGPYLVTINGKGRYAGSSLELDFEIVNDNSLHLATVTGVEPYYMYTGERIQPTPKLTMPDGTVLVEGADYSVEFYYQNGRLVPVDAMQEPGRYWYWIEGLGDYDHYVDIETYVVAESDRVSLQDAGFYIVGVDASYSYTGSEIKPAFAVEDARSDKVSTLVEGRDYTVAYKDNVTSGTATIAITGKGMYKDSLTKTFSITDVSTAKPTPTPEPKGLDVGKTATVGGATYKVTDNAKSTVVYQKAPKNKKTVVIPASVKINGKVYAVAGIAKGAFKGAKAKTVKIKTKKLAKKSVKGCFKGAKKLKTVKVKVGNKKANKKFAKKYKRIFTQKNCGANVAVK